MFKKILNKIILHFKNPILALKFDVRMCYYFYGKFIMKYFYNIKINEEKSYFEPDYCDLYNIFNIIIKYNPKKCIEVGSGYSTLIIAKALFINFKKDKIKPKFISLEQDKNYLEIHKTYLKKNLNEDEYKIVEFIFTDLIIEKVYDEKVNICRNFPDEQFDFFYEDRTDDNNYKIAGDAIKIEQNMPKNYIICVDGMLQTVNFYKKNLKRNYLYSGGFIHGSTWIPKSQNK